MPYITVTSCNGNHSSFLHPRSVGEARSTSPENGTAADVSSQARDGDQEATSAYIKGRNESLKEGKSNLVAVTGVAIVPVKVKAPGRNEAVKTYAFLDSGSNTSFCSEDLTNQLGLSEMQTTLSLTTMEKEDSRAESLVVSLEVSDLDEENLVELPVVFTRPKLPVSVDNAADQEDIDGRPHLASIEIPQIDADVGLLIGGVASEALEPKEIRPSCDGGPYATCIWMGCEWSIRHVSWSSNFIKADVELSKQYRNYCNMEFSDSTYCHKKTSVN